MLFFSLVLLFFKSSFYIIFYTFTALDLWYIKNIFLLMSIYVLLSLHVYFCVYLHVGRRSFKFGFFFFYGPSYYLIYRLAQLTTNVIACNFHQPAFHVLFQWATHTVQKRKAAVSNGERRNPGHRSACSGQKLNRKLYCPVNTNNNALFFLLRNWFVPDSIIIWFKW